MEKVSLLEWIGVNIATIFFILGLILVNVAMYMLFSTAIGLLSTGVTFIVIGLIINYEQIAFSRG